MTDFRAPSAPRMDLGPDGAASLAGERGVTGRAGPDRAAPTPATPEPVAPDPATHGIMGGDRMERLQASVLCPDRDSAEAILGTLMAEGISPQDLIDSFIPAAAR